jgi:hypothetical protein
VQDTLQLSYKVCMSEEWHDETPETDVKDGIFRIRKANHTSVSLKMER